MLNHENTLEDRKKFINKTTRASTSGNTTMVNQNLRYHLSFQNFNFSLEIFIPGKRSKHQKNKQDPILIPPQQNSTTMKHLVAWSMIKFFAQADIFGGIFISSDKILLWQKTWEETYAKQYPQG